MSELSWRYWKGCNKVSEFSRTGNINGWKAENEALYNDYVNYGIVRFNEGRLLTTTPDFCKTPDTWK
jgi:hypothetical protein